MKKIIIIGECTLDIVFPDDTASDTLQLTAMPGGRLLNAAAKLGDNGHNVTYVSESAADFIGDYIISFLARHAVEVKSIDRYTEGITAVNLRKENTDQSVWARSYPKEKFDVVWPRIDEGDIVVFGAAFALTERIRRQIIDIISYAKERKAIIVYIPGLPHMPGHSITRLMPDILENMELADIIVTRASDIVALFNISNSTDAYHRHIRFFCDTYINIDTTTQSIQLFHRDETYTDTNSNISDTLTVNSQIIAKLIAAICDNDLTLDSLTNLPSQTAESIIRATALRE